MNRKRIIVIIVGVLLIVVGGIGYFLYLNGKIGNKPRIISMKKPNPKLCEKPNGIDISHHNIAYDWSKVRVSFCYIRATMGNTIKDNKYHEHRNNASKCHIPMGAYHFLTAKTSAKEQFAFFSSVVKKEHFQLRPMLDVEESEYWEAPEGFTDEKAHDFIREWCDFCKKHYGISPIIYTTEKLYQRYKLYKGFDDCIWWVANYNGIKNYNKKCSIPFTIHQYSNKKYVEGFYGNVDCNRFAPGKSVKDLYVK